MGKIGKRTPTFEEYVPPNYWRQHLKHLAKWMLITILAIFSFTTGVFFHG